MTVTSDLGIDILCPRAVDVRLTIDDGATISERTYRIKTPTVRRLGKALQVAQGALAQIVETHGHLITIEALKSLETADSLRAVASAVAAMPPEVAEALMGGLAALTDIPLDVLLDQIDVADLCKVLLALVQVARFADLVPFCSALARAASVGAVANRGTRLSSASSDSTI